MDNQSNVGFGDAHPSSSATAPIGSKDASGHSDPANSPSAIPPQFKTLFARQGAGNLVHWRVAAAGNLVRVGGAGAIANDVRDRSHDLALRALQAQTQKCTVLSSPESWLIVAQPLSNHTTDCLTVGFPCELSELSGAATESRLAAVQKLGNSLLFDTLVADRREEAESGDSMPADLLSAGMDLPSGASTNQPSEDGGPTWTTLRKQVTGKVLADLSRRRSDAKFYALAVAGLAGIGMIPWPYTVTCKTVCEPSVRRYVAAPFDARLQRAHAVAGQTVAAGDLLVTLDGGDLRSELAGLRSKSSQAEQRLLAALSAGDHSKAEFERLETEQIKQQIELLQRRQRQLEIRSPIDGVIITGDLERGEGMPLSIGDQLFEVASLERLVAEIAIPESEINHIAEGMQVRIAVDAAPDHDGQSEIAMIHLRNELRGNESVFIAEAELRNQDGKLRPGMNGTTQIAAGRRAAAWILFHRPVDAVRNWIGW
ncbi:copper/silver efflux system membrane fusion protein CusB [Rubripirellula lacrimiformis]|uniref:Copper/silver efflux system membrane fusion protein CusB n=1 Tax=Rubripirellula lacrimiformis TaxID=1930273 RepID=A0A517NBD3_9BACT|nr:efflux RND transporter periplasmic adaptor subunit [Rubripirellula lacrimiformis]QDT04441.1 copper/silver efflux system membrane fusion protein CusB [Rubripirellula lacrimiformis]